MAADQYNHPVCRQHNHPVCRQQSINRGDNLH